MLHGRQADLQVILRRAQQRLEQTLQYEHGRAANLASRLAVLAWFALIAAARDAFSSISLSQLAQTILNTALPMFALIVAGLKLRQIRLQSVFEGLPRLALDPTPALSRLSMQLAEWATRAQLMAGALQVRVMTDAAAVMRSVKLDVKLVAAWLLALCPKPPRLMMAAAAETCAASSPISPRLLLARRPFHLLC